MEGWTDFNVALGAGSAALAGLIVVGVSVNIKAVISYPGLSGRAAAALGLLVLTLVGSLVALIPDQPPTIDGLIILAVAGAVWVVGVRAVLTLVRQPEEAQQRRGVQIIGNSIFILGPLALVTSGALLLTFSDPGGAYLVALGSIASLVSAVVFSWIALVEVLR